MKVAIIGTGGREHALAVKSLSSPLVEEVHVIPGNSGMLATPKLQLYGAWDGSFSHLEKYLKEQDITLVIVGNEAFLEAGITDYFSESPITIFGPSKAAARLEYSKDFAKQFMHRHSIPTAGFVTCHTYDEAFSCLQSRNGTLVIKQDGLALGKGVLVTENREEAANFLQESFTVTDTVVFEDFLEGREFSLLAFVNEQYYNLMIPARDYKRAFDGDQGLNTGGMGAYTPVEYITTEDLAQVDAEIVTPTIEGLLKEDISFTGIIYFGLMKTANSIEVIEYNTRFGDPETEVLLEAMQSDLIEVILATKEKRPFTIRWKQGTTLGVCLASHGYPGKYQKGHVVKIPVGISFYSMALTKDDNGYLSNGGRVAFIVASGNSIGDVRDKCYEDIQKISSEGLFWRSDIGL